MWHGDCSTLASLTLSYGMRNVQLNYEQSLFGIRTADCRSLSRALASCETLVHLDLRGNLLDDDKVRQIVAGLSNNCTVTHLDLRHNKVRMSCTPTQGLLPLTQREAPTELIEGAVVVVTVDVVVRVGKEEWL